MKERLRESLLARHRGHAHGGIKRVKNSREKKKKSTEGTSRNRVVGATGGTRCNTQKRKMKTSTRGRKAG